MPDDSAMRDPALHNHRLFMKNGAVFTVSFVEHIVGDTSTTYYGRDNVFLGEVNIAELAFVANLDVPTEVRETPGATPDSPPGRAIVPTHGGVAVTGYRF